MAGGGWGVMMGRVPYDVRKPFDPSGGWLGTAAVTTRGLREDHMAQVAQWIGQAVDAALRADEGTALRRR